MKSLIRITAWLLAVIVVLGLVGAAGGYIWLRGSLPQVAGSVRVQGISGNVEITRDADAVAHIRANSETDALFGLGYAHAQDRLWQMEFQRRIGHGTLSEVLGDATLDTDRFLRTLGPARAAASAWQSMPQPDRALVQAYVDGVNSFIGSHHGRELPIEFTILGFAPAPWTAEDVLVWAKMMAYNLGGNWDDELLRANLIERIGAERTAQLMPAAAENDPLILPGGTEAAAAGAVAGQEPQVTASPTPSAQSLAPALQLLAINRTIQESLGLGGRMIGSNNWVVGGARTTTGKPLLANDPHLGAQVPSIWYLAQITGGGIDAIGATLPGLPGIVIGHNQRIGWGVTNTGPDVQDLFIERINDQNQAEYKGALEPVQILYDTIKVKGKPDVPIRIRTTRHGPLISDVLKDAHQPLAFRWTALDADDNTFPAFLAIDKAQNWQEFTAAMQNYANPMQNFVYADVDGNIGYYAPGKLPIRAKGDGTVPVPGWTGEYDWQGYVPFAELPHSFNPPQGYIASANNNVLGSSYPHLIGTSFAAPYRALRIGELIKAKDKLSPADIAAMQADVISVQARELLPLLLTATPRDEQSKQALALLRNWDGALRGESAQAAIYSAWYRWLPHALIADEIGEPLYESIGGETSDSLAIALPAMLRGENGSWCDNVQTAAQETCADQMGLALQQGLAEMSRAQGTQNLANWRWDAVHHTQFPHNPFDKVSVLKPLFSRSIPNGGDKFTVDVAPVRNTPDDFNQYHVPSYREILDFSNLATSRFIHTVGQSGNLLSGDYANFIQRWQRVEYLPMRSDQAAIEQGKQGTLTLTP